MKTHELKSHPHFFEALKRGDKNFEIRRNDRNYQRGDMLTIRGYDPTFGLMLGEPALRFVVTYMMNCEDFPAIQPGFVIMGIKPLDGREAVRRSNIAAAAAQFRMYPGDEVETEIFLQNRRVGYVDAGKLFLIGKEGHAEPICDIDDLDCLPSLLQQHYRAI